MVDVCAAWKKLDVIILFFQIFATPVGQNTIFTVSNLRPDFNSSWYGDQNYTYTI